ncbi:helix-turn-helix transcriptional regulator [Jannaschia sp. CCS1]|uniref:helix-turn-helix transcriptional regulator n=1 Tax=Jannaschia sp. (strain CCS1) TaxID=290400 RepID=UPI000053C167|nr:helix-turn-helix transcriptional regulator [Jannaschia sp. CCS1]ABD54455.1 transcriptional regulator, LuxR family [Jannaschia sp. CCS1]
MNISQKIMAIYDMAYSGHKWSDALDALLHGTQARHMLVYDTGDRRAISYSNQAGDANLSQTPSALSDYNALIRERGNLSLDAQGSAIIHSRDPFTPVLDQDLWTIDEAHQQRPEIKFTVDRLSVFRRFYVNLSEDPQSFTALITLYPQHLQGIPPGADQQHVTSLAPHLGKAMEIYRTLYGLRQKYNAVLAALDMITVPICIVDESARIMLQNSSAEDLFQSKDGIWPDRAGRLTCSFEDDTRKLKGAVSRMCHTSVGEGDDRSLEISAKRRGNALPLTALATPLRDAEMELEPGLTGTLLTIIDSTRTSFVRYDLLANAYGLTQAECRLLPHVIGGLSNVECAERLGVSPETVKTQVAAILAKTRCRNRIALIWRAYSFSPPIR